MEILTLLDVITSPKGCLDFFFFILLSVYTLSTCWICVF